jgi:LAO/AO transport system kinase
MTDLDELISKLKEGQIRAVARAITLVENGMPETERILESLDEERVDEALVLGITGPPGAGKSTLTNQIIAHLRTLGNRVGIIAIDPSSPISGGAILGDRIRMMQHALDPEVIMRSMATRGRLGGLCASAGAAVRIMATAGCNPIIIETVGVGQSEMDIIRLADVTALVSAPGLGDDIQAMKAGILEVADVMVINKADCPGADLLAMELQAVARERGRESCMTVASEGKGVPEFWSLSKGCFEKMKENGELQRRRSHSRNLEVLDWALELMRPDVQRTIDNADKEKRSQDPRLAAKAVLSALGMDIKL